MLEKIDELFKKKGEIARYKTIKLVLVILALVSGVASGLGLKLGYSVVLSNTLFCIAICILIILEVISILLKDALDKVANDVRTLVMKNTLPTSKDIFGSGMAVAKSAKKQEEFLKEYNKILLNGGTISAAVKQALIKCKLL